MKPIKIRTYFTGIDGFKVEEVGFEHSDIYTGLKDIKGNEIYVNDILWKTNEGGIVSRLPQDFRGVHGVRFIVGFKEGRFIVKNKKSNSAERFPLNSLVIRYYGLKVVGNMMQTPHLMENDIKAYVSGHLRANNEGRPLQFEKK